MKILSMIAFIGLLCGSFLILKINMAEFCDCIIGFFQKKKATIKSRVHETENGNKPHGFQRMIVETKEILAATNRSNKFSFICILAFILFVFGALIGTITSNVFLIPILASGLSFLPFWYVILTSNSYKKHLNIELETALSVITNSYLRCDNILTAIDENVTYLNPPIADIFKTFLVQIQLVNVNIKLALNGLKYKIKNDVFREWCDAVIACQEDHNLKSTLLPIVLKLSDIRVVSMELDYMLYEPMKEFITMAVLLIGNIPLLYFLNKDWYHTLMFSDFGKAILAVTALLIFISLAAVIRLTKPVEYRR